MTAMTPAKSPTTTRDKTHTVLIATSEPDLPLNEVLQRHHYRTENAALSETETIFERIAAASPDLVVVDAPQERPDVLCHTLKDAYQDIPVLLIVSPSGRRKPTNGAVERIIAESGADEVLVRPFKDSDFLAQVRALIRMRARLSALEAENRALREQLEASDRELRAAEQGARELAVMKDAIVNNVSHELRTPMLQVKSSIKMMEVEITNNEALADMGRLLDFATQAASRLESVIQNISQLTTSFSLKIEPFRVQDTVNLALRALSRSWSSASGVNRIQVRVEDTPLVLGDRNGVAQVLQQLVDNALKFSPEDSPVEVIAYQDEGGVLFAVHDEGIGVDEDQIGRIFQEFYQVHQGTTRRYGGVGTGLAIVKLILDGLGVGIKVQSNPGEGSTFSFVLPLADDWQPTRDRII